MLLVSFAALSWASVAGFPEAAAQSDDLCGGFAFQDVDLDGAWEVTSPGASREPEPPAPGAVVEVTAVGGEIVRVITGEDGSWRMPADVVFPVRLDFVAPTGFVIGPAGADAGFATQFMATADECASPTAADGPVGTVGVGRPGRLCADDPDVVTSCFVVGNADGHDDMTSILSVPASTTDNGATDASSSADWMSEPYRVRATVGEVGAVHGLAVGDDGAIYAAAFVKRHTRIVASLNPAGNPTVIYRIEPDGEPTIFVTVDDDATDPHIGVTRPDDYAEDASAVGAVFTSGLGDLQLSADGSALSVVDLGRRQLVEIDIETATVTERIDLDGEALGVEDCAVSDGQPFGDLRPFGLGLDADGSLLVGVVCSAESTVEAADFPVTGDAPGNPAGDEGGLVGYVFDFNGDAFAQRLVVPLAGDRGRMQSNGEVPHDAAWHPWVDVYPFDEVLDAVAYPQPAITDITLDDAGDLIVAIGDRWGNQTAPLTDMPSWDGATRRLGEPLVAGDLQRACEADGGWVIEGSAGCPGGLGSDEHFHDDRYGIHDETALGSVVLVPDTGEVIATHMDPITGDGTWRSGGLIWHDVESGSAVRGLRLYDGRNASPDATFEKATGIGGVALDCGDPPIQFAGMVWHDVDANGVRDVTELGINGVVLALIDEADVVVGATSTDGDGRYFFDRRNVDARLRPGARYRIVMSAGNAGPGEPFGFGGSHAGLTPRAATGAGLDNAAVAGAASTDSAALAWIDVVAGGLPGPGAADGFANHRLGFAMTDQYDLTVEVTVADVDLEAGRLAFDITIRQQGSLSSGGFDVVGEMPAGTSLVDASDGGSQSGATPTVLWRFDEQRALGPQAATTLQMVARIDEQLIEYTAVAAVSADSGDDDDRDDATVGVGEIGGLIWFDVDVSGTRNNDEAAVPPGVAVELRTSSGELVAETATDAAGRYVFSMLRAGDYRVGIDERYFTDDGGSQARVTMVTRPLLDPALSQNEAPGDHRTRPVVVDGAARLGEAIASPSGTFDGASDLLVDLGLVQGAGPGDVQRAERLLVVAVVGALCVVLYVVWRRRIS